MLWFNLNKLENKIVNDSLTDKDGLNYFLAILVFTALIFSSYNVKVRFHLDILISVIIILIVIWGLNFSYRANKKIDGKDFFNRFFALSWIVGIRIILFIVGSALLTMFISEIIPHHYICKYKPVFFILLLFFIPLIWIANYIMIVNAFNRIRKKKD